MRTIHGPEPVPAMNSVSDWIPTLLLAAFLVLVGVLLGWAFPVASILQLLEEVTR